MSHHDLLLLIAFAAIIVLERVLFRRAGSGSQTAQDSRPILSVQPGHDTHFRLAQLETKVSFLMDSLGVKYDPPADQEIRGYLARGMKIEAIKAYRQKNPGSGLAQAKDAVEALEAQIKAEHS